MKTKTTAQGLLTLLLVGSVILNGCNINKPDWSQPIQSTDADKLISDYKTSKSVQRTLDGNNNHVDLREFLFDAKQIDEIMNRNASGTNPGDKDQLAVYFGYEQGNKRWHLVAYGMISPYNVANTGGTVLDGGQTPSIYESGVNSPMPKALAESSRKYYADHSNNTPLTTYDTKDVKRDLNGFSFTASQIRQLLAQSPDQIALDIGLEFPYGSDTTRKRWHLILYGKKGGNPIGGPQIKPLVSLPANGLYFDKADPCPPCNITPP